MEVLSEIVSGIGIISLMFFIVGISLVVVEMFIPGFGLPGIFGMVSLLLCVIFTAKSLLGAIIMILVILGILGIALSIVIHSASKGRLSKKLILSAEIKETSKVEKSEELSYFLDKEGVALTTLRPSGSVDFDGVKLDVISDGDFIQKGEAVKVSKITGSKIVVSRVKK